MRRVRHFSNAAANMTAMHFMSCLSPKAKFGDEDDEQKPATITQMCRLDLTSNRV